MSRITWGAPEDSHFTAGLDRGVLYVEPAGGVPWNGLVSVAESIEGGDLVEQYIDGVKTLQYTEIEKSSFQLEAYYSPEEFDRCDGTVETSTEGLLARNQLRSEFGLSYRTWVGDNGSGLESGYQIHLIYNCLALPAGLNHSTISEQVELETMSWQIATRAFSVGGLAPTAHYLIDTRKVPPGGLAYFEDLLYGSSSQNPSLPNLEELVPIVQSVYGSAVYGDAVFN